ncbi:uncharacterized protein PpBr36_09930 [Pyricularia pennisetigena]|uniref:uncharacterized protein n=1 Tax=Pyricularia pennisetigena TaxID=1578925 RepID=UPI00114E2EA6|nr:uncharacterized protein PpBr36_09930 [Pyricularia pennisetigena]TLS22397.1 hypothetical protein PpBr36_09930 [Pyricularia pennisetigena]
MTPYRSTVEGRVTIAYVNSPDNTTLSGDLDGIQAVERRLKADDVFARKLKVKCPIIRTVRSQWRPAEYLELLEELLKSPRQLKDGVFGQKKTAASRAAGTDYATCTSPNALVIPETTEGVQVQFTMHKCDDAKMLEPGWWEFLLHSDRDGNEQATRHSHGYISLIKPPLHPSPSTTRASFLAGKDSFSVPLQDGSAKLVPPEQVF